ncbi:MAG: RHS repeat-associated core domain-containing protein [Phycisphaerales bacterium]
MDADPPYQGWGWFQHSRPELAVNDAEDPTMLRIYLGRSDVLDFSLVGGSSPQVFAGVNGVQGVVARLPGTSTEPELYVHYDDRGNVFTYFGHHVPSGAVDMHGAKGQHWKTQSADAGGGAATFYVGHATDPAEALLDGFVLDEGDPTARCKAAVDGAGRTWEYTYGTVVGAQPMLTKIEIEDDSTLVWKIEYEYYTSDESGKGSTGDLKSSTETSPLSSGGNAVYTNYFRYYGIETIGGNSYDMRHLIKLHVGPEGARRAAAESVTLSSATDATLKTYASAYYEYDLMGRVASMLTNGGCGCGSGGSAEGLYTFTHDTNTENYNPDLAYTYDDGTATGDWDYDRWYEKTEVTHPDGTKEALYYDEMGWLLARVRGASLSSGDRWIWKYERDADGRVTREYTPDAVNSGSYDNSTGAIPTHASAGLVRHTTYHSSKFLRQAVESRSVSQGRTGSQTTLEAWTYLNPEGGSPAANAKTFGSTNPARLAKALPATHTVYRGSSVTDQTSYSYTFYSGGSSWAVKSVEATQPSLAGGDTSGPSTVTTASFLDVHGYPVFTRDGAGAYTFSMYGDDGQATKRVSSASTSDGDASSASSTFSISLGGGGLCYATAYAYDLQGRLASVTLPDGRVSPMHYTRLTDGRLVTLSVPRLAGGNYSGPVDYTVRNLAGRVEARGVIALGGGTTSTGPSSWISSSADLIGAVNTTYGTLERLSVSLYSEPGTELDETRLFHSIPAAYSSAAAGTHYDATTYAYDAAGRGIRTVDPTGTITYQDRDTLGRVEFVYVGTNDNGWVKGGTSGTNNMVAVETVEYDGGGVGNSRVTLRKSHPTSSSGDDRSTLFTYDYRGRLLMQQNPAAPHAMFTYDDAGNTLAAGGYTTLPGSWSDPTSTASNRVSLSETVYNSRGQVRQTVRHKIDPADGSDDDTLTSSRWYDGAGRVIKASGESLTKTAYDALGRATHTFILASDNDSTNADAGTVSGDTVLEEHQSLYDDSTRSGNLLMSVAISRHPLDTSTTGALDAVSDAVDVVAVGSGSFKGRAQITSYYYDELDRQTATVALGDNGGSSSYTRSSDSSVGSRSATRLISSTAYGYDGSVAYTTDPRGISTVFDYDAAGRQTATIANYADGTPGGGTNGDQDQVTEYAYTGGLLTSLTAKMPGSGNDQVTTYTYGVVTSGTLPSALASNRLLRQVVYPDSVDGSDVVRYAYNRLGQQTGLLDQAGNQINTSYDLLGRETARAVGTLASGFDGAVRRVELAYLSRGPVSTVTQYDAATSGSVTDQVQYEYDGWGNLTHFHQDVDSAMSSPGVSASGRGAFTVQHDLTKSAPSGGVQALRRTATYAKAAGTTFHQAGYAYGSATINDYASRVAGVTVGSSPVTVATYSYLGTGHLVGTTLDQANLNTSVFTESGGTHTYADLDRFNRPTRWNWERVGGASGGFYNTAIAYDENSNPTSTTDDAHARNNSSDHPFDVVYGLDSLSRVISTDEGNIDAGAIESGTRTRKELWNSLSLTGNWGSRQLDANGDGDYGDETDRDEPSAYNTFNKANEWTARRVAKAGGSDRDEHAYTYDAAGNLTDLAVTVYRGMSTALSHRRLVYDAFGRLVRVAAVEGMDETDVAVYRYNGLNMRLMWQDDADADSTLESGERFYVMHDERWRPVATFRDTDATPKEAFVWHAAGQGGFGGSSYIDSVILRDRDNYTGGTPNGMTSASDGTLEERRYSCQNWRADVVAVTKADGTPLEYVRYSPYGEPTVYPVADLNMDGVVNSTDSGLWSDLIYIASNSSVYADTDLDWDGADDQASSGIDSDLFYESYAANTGLSGVGRVSSAGVANRVGYAGYQWDQTISACHVRYRVYLPDIGRWTRRDPLGYVDGMGLYEYCMSAPVEAMDSRGLSCLMDCAGCLSNLIPLKGQWRLLRTLIGRLGEIVDCTKAIRCGSSRSPECIEARLKCAQAIELTPANMRRQLDKLFRVSDCIKCAYCVLIEPALPERLPCIDCAPVDVPEGTFLSCERLADSIDRTCTSCARAFRSSCRTEKDLILADCHAGSRSPDQAAGALCEVFARFACQRPSWCGSGEGCE